MPTAASEDPRSQSDGRSSRIGHADAEDVSTSFQLQVWGLLSKQVTLYTMGESTSLPEYDAHRLLASTCFVLGVNPDDADTQIMRDLVEHGVENTYARNLKHIEKRVERVSNLWNDVCLSMPLLESVALEDTLESLRGFPSRYEPRFFAHEIPADIDYPLCRPVGEATLGVEYVTTYLERLLVECRFLALFDVGRCSDLLRRVHPEYGELIVNLFEPIAANAVGCALAEKDVRELRVDGEDCQRIESALKGLSAAHVRRRLKEAAERAGTALALDSETQAYLSSWAANIAPRANMGAQRGSLAGVFLDF